MKPPSGTGPELLYRKPGTVAAAQALMWIQFSLLICFGSLWSTLLVFGAGLLAVLDVSELYDGSSEYMAAAVVIFIVLFVLVAVLYGVVAAKLGAGRRWAQVVTILLMLAVLVLGLAGFASTPGFADGDAMLVVLAWAVMPAITIVCLCTGSAMQWFKQSGREPWRFHYPPGPWY